MKIKCQACGYTEKTNKEFFVKVIGLAMPVGGLVAWTTFFFAGTGFALPIVTAMVIGGPAILIYKNKIVKWVCNKGYECPQCKKIEWKAI